jgi:hypothetical protein
MQDLGAQAIAGVGRDPSFSRVRLLLSPAEIAALRGPLAALRDVFWLELPTLGLPPTNVCNGGTVVNTAQRKVLAVDFLASGECAGGIAGNEWDTHGHGSHVAGTVAGDNFANLLLHDTADGMAPGAKLLIQDAGFQTDNCGDLPGIGCPVVDLKPIFQQAYDQGARLHTNSWGDNENGAVQNNYTAASQDVKVVGATTSTVLKELGSGANDNAVWAAGSADVTAFAGQTVRILIEAADAGSTSLVEAAVDDVKIVQQP